ncbi:TonB-dependent siderophore receptor [Methyloligella solikamskensis]|uniref:TonB-dependent siderophore receptor n=1 Tax=Methyloligella solikamskensis TaxID=1177756 RepID=A0ABW3JCH0_9HYPH
MMSTALAALPVSAMAQETGAQDAEGQQPGESAETAGEAETAPVQEVESDATSTNQILDPIVVEGAEPRPAPVRPSLRPTLAPAAVPAPVETPQEVDAEIIDSEDIYGIPGYPITTRDTYTVGVATNGGRDPQPVKDIPQSLSIVTQERMEDQNLTTLDDAMRNTTGMVVLNNDQGRSSIFSRGYEFQDAYVDGLPAPLASVYGTVPDLAPYDRIEVLKGPAGMFSGSGEPAGILNLVRKRPFDVPAMSASALVGSWDYYRGEVDVSTPIGTSGKVRARAVGAYTDHDTWVDNNGNEAFVGYGIIEADITNRTTLSFSYRRQDRDIQPFNGLPAYADGTLLNVDRSTFIGGAWNTFDNATNDYHLDVHHDFAGGGYFQAGARWVDTDVFFDYAYSVTPVDPITGDVNTRQLARNFNEETFSADAHVSLPFQAIGLEQNVLLGSDYRKYKSSQLQFINQPAGIVNVFDPDVSNVVRAPINWQDRTDQSMEQTGLYGQLRLKPIEPLMVILGGRVDWYQSSTANAALPSGLGNTIDLDYEGETTPYAGVIFDLNDNVSAYASYTSIFQPQTELTAADQPLKPRVGDQYEIGLKSSFFDDRLNASIAHFDIRDENRAVADPFNPGSSLAVGEVEVQGVETEISGSPMDGLNLYAGYTYTHTQYIQGAVGQDGATFSTWTPKHIVQLWGEYRFQKGTLQDFHVGAGGRYLSSFFTEGTMPGPTGGPYRLEQDGYVVVDTSVGYTFKNDLDLTFSVNNLFDEKYYARLGSPMLFNFYGAPRSYWLRASMDF